MELDHFHQVLKSALINWLHNPNEATEEELNSRPCPDDEFCEQCVSIFCPHDEPLHNHHDGCPSCWQMDDAEYKSSLATKHGVVL